MPPRGIDPHATTHSAFPFEDDGTAVVTGLPADAVPGFELLDELGRGGMGIVYRAMQQSPDRLVAMKILLHGAMAGERARRRFEREVDLAASLRHPHIVGVIDGGYTPAGLPFLAMEYIEGEPLDVYLRRPEMAALEPRLKLFAAIARAVGHAHQRGVIHRDLKPGNIRVDPAGEPHLLDFGLAKQLDEAEDLHSTRPGEFAGTLAYAAPEQAAGEVASIDTRTDVYALGAMLYEIVTDQLPLPLRGSLPEMLAAIQTDEPRPLRPLARSLFAVPPVAPAAAPARPGVDDRLDAVVMKCLTKDRNQRYRTAGDLADDVERFLAGDPVTARPPSTLFLMRRWWKRHAQASLWTVVIGVVGGAVPGVLLAVTVAAMVFQDIRQVYAEFPSEQAPWLVRMLPTQVLLGVGGMEFAFVALLSWLVVLLLGWATVGLVRPRTRTGLVAACGATGGVAGLTASVCGIGWLAVVGIVLMPAQAAVIALADSQSVGDLHPDLRSADPTHARSMLAQKLLVDQVAAVPLAVAVSGLLVPLAFVLCTLAGGGVTAYLARSGRPWFRRIAVYLEIASILTWAGLLTILWLTPAIQPGLDMKLLGPALLTAVMCVALHTIGTRGAARWCLYAATFVLAAVPFARGPVWLGPAVLLAVLAAGWLEWRRLRPTAGQVSGR